MFTLSPESSIGSKFSLTLTLHRHWSCRNLEGRDGVVSLGPVCRPAGKNFNNLVKSGLADAAS